MKAVVVALVVASATSAHADPTGMSAEARKHFDRGTASYESGDYTAAITELQAGQQIDPNPGFLYALGQAYRMLGDCPRAVAQYLAFLDTHPPAYKRRFVRANITRCSEPTFEVTTSSERTTPEDLAIPPPPIVTPPPPPPSLTPEPRIAEPLRPHRHFYDDVAGDAAAAGGAVAVGVGVTYLVLGERQAKAANSASTVSRLEQLSASSSRERMIGEVGVIAGGALAVAAIVRYVIVAREPSLSIAVQGSGALAVWSERF